jgi:hypothetical protein
LERPALQVVEGEDGVADRVDLALDVVLGSGAVVIG